MRLKEIKVDELFGMYNYDLTLFDISNESHYTIIDGLNGMGKTTILKLIKATCDGDVIYLDSIPFKRFVIIFDNTDSISVEKEDIYFSMINDGLIKYRNQVVHESGRAISHLHESNMTINGNIMYSINREGKSSDYSINPRGRYAIQVMRRIMAGSERMLPPDRDYSIEDIFDMGDLLEELNNIKKTFKIFMIDTDRLHYKEQNREENILRSRRRFGTMTRSDQTIEHVRSEIIERIRDTGNKFARKSEELDRSFPMDFLNAVKCNTSDNDSTDKETLDKFLEELETKRKELQELGLITDSGDLEIDVTQEILESPELRTFLSVYAENNLTKLEVYKNLSEKMRLFMKIINDENVFTDKEMKFDLREGIKFTTTKPGHERDIPIQKLSSGEKNNLVLFYELIFNCLAHSLVLVDEPEISLHVAWQRAFIDELDEICRYKGLQAIVATHSPDIVNGHMDFMVDLEELDNE